MTSAMKPTARRLALFEAYANFESNHSYTKTIGLANTATDLPQEIDTKVRGVFSINRAFLDIYSDQKLKIAKDQIEEQSINLLTKVIAENDKSNKPVEISLEQMKSFLLSYEQLRQCEKRLVAKGHSERLFTRGKIYGRLIKIFATRSEKPEEFHRRPSLQETAAKFRRRPSLQEHPTNIEAKGNSPRVSIKKVLRKSIETQTMEEVRMIVHTQET
jgi:hypothetical protein